MKITPWIYCLPATLSASCFFLVTATLAEAEVMGDCGEQSCTDVFSELAVQWPERLERYVAECDGNKQLDLRVFSTENEQKRASFVCWEAPNANGERSGYWLGMLPFNPDDATFASRWRCTSTECEQILARLEAQSPQQLRNYEFECATKAGRLNLLISQSNEQQVNVKCNFDTSSFYDVDGDGTPEYEEFFTVDIILDTLAIPE